MKNPPKILSCVSLQWTKLMHDVRGCVAIEFTWVAPPEESRERACTCSPLSHSHLPACTCLCNPAASPPIILSTDPCLMVVSGLQHHQLSDCCTLCTLTRQLKMIYKWSFQFQIESSKRLWCSLWYQRHPSNLGSCCLCICHFCVPGVSPRIPVLHGLLC